LPVGEMMISGIFETHNQPTISENEKTQCHLEIEDLN
jgi:hypothetical protein